MKIVDEYFGCDVFSTSAMQKYLPHAVYKQMIGVIEKGQELPREIADIVANAMKDWAMDKGATHYTHWFQPMTGITAENMMLLLHLPDLIRLLVILEVKN